MKPLGEDRIDLILMFALPKTIKQLRAFLGEKRHCKIWIPGYSDLARHLYRILKKAQKDLQPFIDWNDKSKNVSRQL
jgi:hypothetical protein